MPSGGYRPGAGRPRKHPEQKKLEGRPVSAPRKPPPKKVSGETVLADYFEVAMREAGDTVPAAAALRAELLGYIAAHGCEGMVAPQIIDDYCLNRQGFLACEFMNRKLGRVTSDHKLSPYVSAAHQYQKAMNDNFNAIQQAIVRYGDKRESQANEFLLLLQNRGF
jgi:hypothetical protein